MSIFRKHESRTVSVAFEAVAWVCVILFGLTIAYIVGMWIDGGAM